MYPIMGGQMVDMYKALRDAYDTYERVEQARRQAELFRQHQEGYEGRAVSREAQVEAEQIMDAWGGRPPQEATRRWEKKWGMPWSAQVEGFKTGETRTQETRTQAEIRQDMRHIRDATMKSLAGIAVDPQLMADPARKAAAIQQVRQAAAAWFNMYEANPKHSDDPFAKALIGTGRADLMSLPLLSITPPTVSPKPEASTSPLNLGATSRPMPMLGAPGTAQGGFGPTPGFGGPGGQPDIDPEDVLLLQEIYKEIKRRKAGQGGITAGPPITGPYGEGSGLPRGAVPSPLFGR